METSRLHQIFFARSVAIVGASTNETKRGFRAIETLLREKYEGKIYPVNPKLDFVQGLKCYHVPSVTPVAAKITLSPLES